MRILKGLGAVRRAPVRAVATVGVFDGVHVAHQRLIRSTVRLARRLRGTAIVVTFDPDPQVILSPSTVPPALMPLEERLHHLAVLGVDWVWVIPFTARFAQTTAEQFVRRILVERLRATTLIVGERFVFGNNRRGNLRMLRTFGATHGLQVVPVPSVRRSGRLVSSSRIRRLIGQGQLAAAKRLLGYPPTLYGTVVRGAGRGKHLGVPTANVQLVPQTLPPQGVYAVTAVVGTRRRAGAMNFGTRPTFGPGPLVCEVHLLEFSGALNGQPIALELLTRLRRERCFENPGALIRQVQRDLARPRRLFARYTRP